MPAADTGSVVTVEGRLDPDELGITLTHEHLFVDWTDRFELPDSPAEQRLATAPVSLETMWYVRTHPNNVEDNLTLESFEEAVEETSVFREAGGQTIVDASPKNVGADPVSVREVGRETGLQFVHGTGYYTRNSHPDRVDAATVAELADEFVSDVREGIGDTDVRAGLIGEIGLSGRIHDQEEKVLRAAARAAARTGAPMSVHPPGRTPYSQRDRTYPSSRWGLDVLDIAEEEGLSSDRVILCHMDRSRWYESLDYQREIADRGGYVEYDLYGQQSYFYREEFNDADPSDILRSERIAKLIEDGYASQLLISQDVYLKSHRRTYGGFGYVHILDHIQPQLSGLGVSDEQIRELLVENPKRLLTFVEPVA